MSIFLCLLSGILYQGHIGVKMAIFWSLASSCKNFSKNFDLEILISSHLTPFAVIGLFKPFGILKNKWFKSFVLMLICEAS
jgi:hypothetical protein